jgi:hypothetical protein
MEKYELEKHNAGGRLLRGDIFTSRYKLHSDTLASFPPRTIFAFSPSKRLSPVTLVVFGVNALPGDEVAQALGSLDWQRAGSASELENLARRACCAVVAIPRLSDPGVLAWFVPLLKRYPRVGWVLLTSFSRGNASRLVDLPGLSHVVWFEEIHTALAPTVVRVLQADTLACLATAIEAAGELPQELRLGLALACTMPRPPRTVAGLCRALGIEEGRWRYLWRKNMAGAASPKEFVDWLLLGVALCLRPIEGSWAAVANRMGLSEETLREVSIRRTGHRPSQLSGFDPGMVRAWSGEWWAKARAG